MQQKFSRVENREEASFTVHSQYLERSKQVDPTLAFVVHLGLDHDETHHPLGYPYDHSRFLDRPTDAQYHHLSFGWLIEVSLVSAIAIGDEKWKSAMARAHSPLSTRE